MAHVKLIQVHYLDIFKWLRKEMNMSIIEAKDLSKNGAVVFFGNDFEKALDLYRHIQSFDNTSAQISIDDSYDNRGRAGSYGVSEEQIIQDELYRNEFNS